MMDGIRMVKVDNWSMFFLQKLQALYTRGDFCDLTLQFHTNECIRVHRLVLNTCTDYFETLIKANNVTNNHMRLPQSLQSDVVVPIINFMYSGRLEFRPELHTRLYKTARILNMQILTKLLDTHAGPLSKSGSITATNTPVRRIVVTPGSISSSSNSSVNTRPVRSDSEHSEIVPGKRLPIWKKRTSPSSFSVNVTQRNIADEPAKPTRFEWPEDDDSQTTPLLYSSTFDDISYDSVPIVKSINSLVQSSVPSSPSQPLVQLSQERVMPAATFESVYQSANLKRGTPTFSASSEFSQSEASSSKKIKVDIDVVKELTQEQEVRKALITKSDDESEHDAEDLEDFLPGGDMDDDEEDLDDPAPLTPVQTTPPQNRGTPKPILKVHDSPDSSKEGNSSTPSKKVRFSLEPKVHTPLSQVTTDGPSTSGVAPVTCTASSVPSMSAATAPNTVTSTPAGAQTTASTVSTPSEAVESTSSVLQKTVVTDSSGSTLGVRATTISVTKSADGTTVTQKVPNVNNHAKIIAEVLKKYPDLVKNNKNIRLKIMQKDGSPTVSVERSGGPGDQKAKVSYMVVKADQAVKAKVQLDQTNQQSGAHNTTGPWLCSKCGQPDKPINFETYYLYRKHLQEVHQEKIDVRICEHCGHRASKRNLLLYHLFTKHNIPPPRNCQFPKCDQCDHVALSEALLVKHKNVHGSTKDFSCRLCNSTFKNYGALQTHMQTNLHCDQTKKNLDCLICHKKFTRPLHLKAHIRSDHKDAVAKLLDDNVNESNNESNSSGSELVEPEQAQLLQQVSPPNQGQMIQTQSVQNETQQQTTFILPPGVTLVTDNPGTLMPSTEAEALSNVASGIAASLGVADSMVVGEQSQHQTLILVDKNQLSVHEYIVPDIMTSDMGQGVGVYTSGQLPQLVQYTTAGGLQQPVTVSEQGLMTITTVSANGSIVNHTVPQQTSAQIMQQPLVSIAQGQISDHNTGEIAMILTDHAYSGGIVRENGTVMQTSSAPLSMNMVSSVPSNSVMSVMPAVVSEANTIAPTVEYSRTTSDIPQLVPEVGTVDKVEADDTSDPPHMGQQDRHTAAPQTQKMAELVSDWDDMEEEEGNIPKPTEHDVEDAAMPSRPTIMLKSELDHDLSDNLVKIT